MNDNGNGLQTASEWSRRRPSGKGMGVVRFVLDEDVTARAEGIIYGMEFFIEAPGFSATLFFDHYNRRLRVMDYQVQSHEAMTSRLLLLARKNGYGKVFIKTRPEDCGVFLGHGFVLEGTIPGYFRGVDAFVVSRFPDPVRAQSEAIEKEEELLLDLSTVSQEAGALPAASSQITMHKAGPADINELVDLYRGIFVTYPSPLSNPDYVLATMKGEVIYRVARLRGKVIGAASADIDSRNRNAEMTDCATSVEARGRGVMKRLLSLLEQDLREAGILTAYTLCRAGHVGMNRVYHRLSYAYTGRLINNCDIAGRFENMNIWTKNLTA